ncbi:putative quinol monooxygenase [Streptosporangium sp. NPDC048865]|uniref:putative quinol monooxygenase n=1 Tax=Streptosporangium sp. NPDC048865 TaxID=3155766 RepID=UPI0034309B76
MSDTGDAVPEGLVPAEVLASTGPVAVHAVGRVKPGRDKEFEELIKSVLPLIREEQGCEQYVVHTDGGEPGVYLIYERFSSGADMVRHLTQPFMRAYFEEAGRLLEGRLEAKWLRPLDA